MTYFGVNQSIATHLTLTLTSRGFYTNRLEELENFFCNCFIMKERF